MSHTEPYSGVTQESPPEAYMGNLNSDIPVRYDRGGNRFGLVEIVFGADNKVISLVGHIMCATHTPRIR